MTQEKIAVIGMTCRFPDAPDAATFWNNLINGACAIGSVADEEIIAQGGTAEAAQHDDFVNAGTRVADADLFDAAFFGISPREAVLTDPQHRLFLQECRVLMDLANLTGGSRRIGVYAACRQSTYQDLLKPIRPQEITKPETFQQLLGNDKDYLATRVAYRLNLTGPAMTVQTACSSSLVAVHLACEALRSGEADAAIAGGVGISFPQGIGYLSQPGMIFSVSGLCRPFGAAGDGIVAGNGLGIVALKRLADAERDGDKILAVIRGSAVSNDGAEKVGFTAPGANGQMTTIRRALNTSGVDPKDVGLVEAHATGTPLGDPIEVSALDAIYRDAGVTPGSCAIGSVKGNVGHLDTAAGIASLIKSILAVKTGQMPKTLHAQPENPHINFAQSAFHPLHETRTWPEMFDRRIAAVSSFGIGGTNCHMLVEEPPKRVVQDAQHDMHILALSARSDDGLAAQARTWRKTLEVVPLAGACRTAALRRVHFSRRRAVVGRDVSTLLSSLQHVDPCEAQDTSSVALMFSGQGSQVAGMGVSFLENKTFLQVFETCIEGFAQLGFSDLREVMHDPTRASDLDRTQYTQPALFTFQTAYTAMLQTLGVQADLVFGHSIGEFAAAVKAGVLSQNDAIRLISERARLMEHDTAPGAMLALNLPASDAEALIAAHPDVSLAAINGVDRVVVSGALAAIDHLENTLKGERVWTRRLNVNRAFHSAMMDDIIAPMRSVAHSVTTAIEPNCRMLSTFTGELASCETLDADYWASQLRAPVRFGDAVGQLQQLGITQVIEIGPDGSFANLLRAGKCLPENIGIVGAGLDSPEDLIAALYEGGHDRPLTKYYEARLSPLETVPALSLEPERFWPEPKPQTQTVSRQISNLDFVAGDSAVEIVADGPMPISGMADLVSRNDGFMGSVTAKFQTTHGLTSVNVVRRSGSFELPDAPSLPLDDAVSGKYFRSAWLAPEWALAKHARQTEDAIWLEHGRTCVGRIVVAAQDDAWAIAQWSWQWARGELPKTSTDKRIEIMGEGELADELRAATGVCEQDAKMPPDAILDLRLAELDDGMDTPDVLLQAAYEVAQSWIAMGERHPNARGIVVLPDAPGDVPGSGGWAVQALWRSLCNEVPLLNVSVAFVAPNALRDLIDCALADEPLPPVMRIAEGYLSEPLLRETRAQRNDIPLTWDGITLIAGFGAVGTALAKWLVNQGAKSIAFVMHRALSGAQKKVVRALRARGTTVHIVQADLINQAALHARISALPGPVLQVFHTGHAGRGGVLRDNDPDGFLAAIRVKTQGSVALWEAVKDQPLNLFCLFSSAAPALALPVSVPGVGYVVANAWQDAFAAKLRADGAPAQSIAWGQWEMTRKGEKEASQDAFVQPISEADGFQVLNALLKSGASGTVPIRYQADRLRSVVDGLPGTRPVFKDVLELQDYDLGRGPDEATDVEDLLCNLVATRLKTTPDALISDKPLTEQGVDSLIFLEIVQIINRQFGLSLPPTAGYDHSTLARLAAHIKGQGAPADVDFSHMLDGGHTVIEADPASAHAPFPLTDLQQAFWLGRGQGMNMGGVACHEYVELAFDALDTTRLEDAWNRLIMRHDMMRCVITTEGQQIIQPSVPRYHVVEEDLSQLDEESCAGRLERTRQRMTYQVFDPAKWPLFELRVSRLPGGQARVHLDMDLLVFDIQSFRVIYSELATLLDNPRVALPELALTFRDYVMAEKALEASESWQEARAYWQERLDDFHPAPDLPLIRDPETVGQPQFRCLTHRLDPKIWRAFQDNAARHGLTPSAVMLTAYTHAIAAFAKAPDFTLNVTYFNRKNVHPQVMDICGDFTSLMLLPVSARTDADFLSACKVTQEELWQALAHRDYNGLRVMRDLGRRAGGGAESVHMPVVFTSMIGMDFDDPNQPGYELRKRQVYEVNQTPQVWLDYQATEYGGALMTRWFVADELFDPSIIAAMFARYTSLLDWLATHPEAWADALPDLRSTDEVAAMEALHRRDDTRLPSHMAELRPVPDGCNADAPAILTIDSAVSHAELERRVNQLAHYLLGLGLKPGVPVAVILPKGIDAVIAALAIQMAGGCYVPINADFPEERLATILNDLSPFAAIGDRKIDPLSQFIWIDLDNLDVAAQPVTRPILTAASEPSYIIYTSGTTGTPKGVVLDHAAPINTLHQLGDILKTNSNDRALSMCAFHHDMSVFDIFAMMACKGAFILPEGQRALDPDHWVSLMKAHQPTILNAVPAFISLLLDAIDRQAVNIPAPRHIMMGGDWVPTELVARIRRYWPGCRIHSIGGPTETAIVSMHYEIGDLELNEARIPYGRPLANQTCHLLNDAGQDCPPGVVGEICMGGLACSIGYHDDPDRTAARYKPHPITGETLFHTGDLGVLREDGQLDILGRIDNQIKINGQRIEASEIESAIEAQPQIDQAVVLYGGAPVKQLQGFVRSHATKTPIADEGAWRSIVAAGIARIGDLPDSFDLATYANQYDRLERYATLTMLRTLQDAGFFKMAHARAKRDQLFASLLVAKTSEKLFESWLRTLCEDGFLYVDGEELVATARVADIDTLAELTKQIAARTAAGEGHEQRIWSLISRCADRSAKLLRAEFNPLELMFEAGKTDFVESWYRENPVSQHFNTTAGYLAAQFLKDRSGPLRILEFGAGIGSATHDVLRYLDRDDFSYDFTDLSDYFLDDAKQTFAEWPQMRFGLFDINDDPGLQGYELGSYDLIIGANVLHDASDANASSRKLRALLKPDGAMLLIEGTTNPRFQMISLGFVEGLTHYADDRLDTYLPMLSAPRWQALLERAGFSQSAIFPPPDHPVEAMNYHVVLAQNDGTDYAFDLATVGSAISQKLPAHMVPVRWHQLESFPLTRNGKIDRSRLNPPAAVLSDVQQEEPLVTQLQRELADLWSQVLGDPVGAADANFFVCGGDSLLMTRLASLLQGRFELNLDLATLLRHPILREQADLIEAARLIEPIQVAAFAPDQTLETGVI